MPRPGPAASGSPRPMQVSGAAGISADLAPMHLTACQQQRGSLWCFCREGQECVPGAVPTTLLAPSRQAFLPSHPPPSKLAPFYCGAPAPVLLQQTPGSALTQPHSRCAATTCGAAQGAAPAPTTTMARVGRTWRGRGAVTHSRPLMHATCLEVRCTSLSPASLYSCGWTLWLKEQG